MDDDVLERDEELMLERTYQPSRMVVGHCPNCRRVVGCFNEYGTWPPIICKCGWAGPTTEIDNYVRFEREGIRNVSPETRSRIS